VLQRRTQDPVNGLRSESSPSDWFRVRCKALCIYQRYRDFHALCTTVGTALRAVDPQLGEALITAVMGHEADNVGAAHYHRPAPKTLQRELLRRWTSRPSSRSSGPACSDAMGKLDWSGLRLAD
jgi:hypothetical protein